jgi:phospholipid/cholesterol/gamma-HCH transport system substrate-binding protein
MKSNRVNYIVVGSFVLLMLLGFIGVAAYLTGRGSGVDPYYAVYSNVTGVKYGTKVMYEGYAIGQVQKVVPFEEQSRMRFRVDFAVAEGWRLPRDSVATIAAPGLLAAVTISISAGRSAESLEPGQQVRSGEGANMLAGITDLTTEIGAIAREDLRPLLANLNVITDSMAKLIEGDAAILIADLRSVSDDVARTVPGILSALESASRRMDQAATNINGIVGDGNRKTIEGTLQNMASASADFAKLAAELKGTRKQLDQLLGSVNDMVADNRVDIEKAIVDARFVMGSVARHIENTNQNLEATIRNMYEFSRQIRQNPSLLLRGGAAPDEAAAR